MITNKLIFGVLHFFHKIRTNSKPNARTTTTTQTKVIAVVCNELTSTLARIIHVQHRMPEYFRLASDGGVIVDDVTVVGVVAIVLMC